MRIMHGRDRGIPSPEEALAELGGSWTPPRLGDDGARMIAGDPAQVRDELHRIAAHCAVDELMIVTVTHDWAARVRSYELIAEAMGLEARSA
jgi:alkanesulfonate monooxygenase SsuD/methylene tetrahydromethanopterin reductase-like flavin-dependent oxidoreductase (luciferase family)